MEIVSICCNQNVNSVNVELKQWLYKNGDQCVWNTGGWMKCQCGKSISTTTANGYTSTASVDADVTFSDRSIDFSCYGHAGVYSWNSNPTRRQRAGFSVNTNFGTKKTLNMLTSLYSRLRVITPNNLQACFRTGTENGSSTSINTATILQKGSINANNGLELTLGDLESYLVLGNNYSVSSVGSTTSAVSDANFNCNSTITEIWLE